MAYSPGNLFSMAIAGLFILWTTASARRALTRYGRFHGTPSAASPTELEPGTRVMVSGRASGVAGGGIFSVASGERAIYVRFEEDLVLFGGGQPEAEHTVKRAPVFAVTNEAGAVNVETQQAVFLARMQSADIRSNLLFVLGTLLGKRYRKNQLFAILEGDDVRICGTVVERGGAKVLRSDRRFGPALISNLTDRELRGQTLVPGLGFVLLIPVLMVFGLAFMK